MPGNVSVPLNDARIASWMSKLKSTAPSATMPAFR